MVEFVSNNFCGSGFKLKIHDTDTYEILWESRNFNLTIDDRKEYNSNLGRIKILKKKIAISSISLLNFPLKIFYFLEVFRFI